ncbi:MAG: 7TM diverse intracellular signaling domain-containing protein [Flavipsychrobacter sp.]
MNENNNSNHFLGYSIYTLLLAIVFSACSFVATAQVDTFHYNDGEHLNAMSGTYFGYIEDENGILVPRDIIETKGFNPIDKETINLGVSKSTFWLKAYVQNNTAQNDMYLVLQQPLIDFAELYEVEPNGRLTKSTISKSETYKTRKHEQLDYVFNINIPSGQKRLIILKVKNAAPLVFPVKLGNEEQVFKAATNKELILGFYSGIILVMCIYNIFVYFSVRDKSYILYVIYILTVGLTQVTLQDFTFKYLWPNSPWLALQGPVLLSCISSIAALQFIKEFLRTKEHVPRLHIGLHVFIGVFVVSAILNLTGMRVAGFQLMQAGTALASIYALFISYKIYKMNYRPAKFFLLAWSILLLGAIVFVLKDVGVMPYNYTTSSAIQITSVIEIVLLSFALADKINMFRKEKEESQAQALAALEENARITRQQNVILETKVNERTIELKQSNEELSKTLTELKEAESQLVESEKMASLGQLTAGIAHEINNPINFVTSNVKPLRRDVDMLVELMGQIEELVVADGSAEDKKARIEEIKEELDFDYLKEEIDYLLKGINEGSSRTAEIVKGLRVFSRLDEDDLKKANLNEGIDSTLIIANNVLGDKIKVIKNLGNLPLVECYPGKLNQVFLNMISNAAHAITERFGSEPGGELAITTYQSDDNVCISLKDNGVGMDAETQKKIFEPFFTTKDVGEGTGLGMSIVYNTLNKHNGKVDLKSEVGVGTEFIITLPIVHENTEN